MINIQLHHTQITKINNLIGKVSTSVDVRGSLLKMVHEGLPRKQIAKILNISEQTITNIKKKFLHSGLEEALYDKPRSGRPIEIDEPIKCEIVAIACSDAPEGYNKWTLELIQSRLCKDRGITISKESIRLVLKDHQLKPWQQQTWCIPEVDDQFLDRMEDVLEVYERPYNKSKPVVCLDEKPVPMKSSVRDPVPMKAGAPTKVDYEYQRNGQATVFVAVEPHTGKIATETRKSRKGKDFAQFLLKLSKKYSQAEKIVLVMDNLSTHFESAVERRYGERGEALWSRFEVHYTPVHASWLNQAEIAISVLESQCLSKKRVDGLPTLIGNVKAWTKSKIKTGVKINWKFSREKARKKFDYKRQ